MRVSRLAPLCAIALACTAGVTAAAQSRADDWREPVVLALLLAFAVIADRLEIRVRGGIYLAGSLPVFVIAAVLFGPAPAVAVAVASSFIQPRKAWQLVAGDLAVFGTFPLVTGMAARALVEFVPSNTSLWFSLLVAGLYMLAWALNLGLVVAYMRAFRGRRFGLEFAATWRPLLSTQLALALGTAILAYAYIRLGAAAIVFAGVLIVVYSRLQRDLMEAERLRDEAQERNEELAAANERLRRSHMGALRSLVRSIHLHDQMTARHSAAVARYARAIAAAAGCSEDEQHVVHTAGLLHDVGKHILDDAILKGDTKLNDSQWALVKRHPEEGARIVRLLEGHEEIAEIIHAHHERIDGRGYPRGLQDQEIPLLSRMISIADTYDVMTARDSYRNPVPPAEAVAELRRVSGAQLDAELVETFVHDVLGHEATAFGHGDDADFEAELAFGPLGDGRDEDGLAVSGDAEQSAPELTAVA
jgi:putative nucleotidyltransferase with HDIG domain